MTDVLHLIDGKWVAGEGDDLPIIGPIDGNVIGQMACASRAQVNKAVAAARIRFDNGIWRNTPIGERRAVLRAIAGDIRAARDDLARRQMLESGILLSTAQMQVDGAAAWFDYFADFLSTVSGKTFDHLPQATTLVTQEPIGVCALFSPWNVPIGLTAIKLAPALAAGNSVVVKPSEETPGCTANFVEVVTKSLPDGVLNLVNGRGADTGAALANGDVDMISFTGGHAGGRAVAEAAASRHIPCVMELGGKSASIIFADCDRERAMQSAVLMAFTNNGEACLAGSRLLIEENGADDFIAELTQRVEALSVGPPDSADTQIGPLISAAHRDYVAGFYDSARQEGGKVLCGGEAIGPGFGISPGAIHVTSPDSRVWCEEVFGPLVAVSTFKTEDEAIRLANDSRYGLSGYLWTGDASRALRVSKAIRTGTILVNSPFMRELNAPFGGFKASGVGREGGVWSWNNFTETKTTILWHGE
ncbi:MAG: aldehyde dehydrogenase family protein [Pseudomonadota bacterium]